MLTQCPQCQTIYQIGADELSAARGFVECGECGHQFSALDRIADEPAFSSEDTTEPPASSGQKQSAPRISLLDENSDVLVGEVDDNAATDFAEQKAQGQPAFSIAEKIAEDPDTEPQADMDTTVELARLDDVQVDTAAGSTPPGMSLPSEEHEILFTEPDLAIDEELVSDGEVLEQIIDAETDIDLDDAPPILHKELLALKGDKKPKTKWYWSVFAAALFMSLAVQAAWYYRHALLGKFPAAYEPVAALCEKLGCELETPDSQEPIQLVSRDVRTHPRYQNALLVNASLINSGTETTPFPTVQLGLFDNTGTAIGIRQFSPNEYLDKSIDIAAGIPPGRSVHVVMELANMADRASSFEFSFH
ncbi:MAG: zinc-ribbon and DUF3426 domain-containing protein [Gammaproteobacteria bacterium]